MTNSITSSSRLLLFFVRLFFCTYVSWLEFFRIFNSPFQISMFLLLIHFYNGFFFFPSFALLFTTTHFTHFSSYYLVNVAIYNIQLATSLLNNNFSHLFRLVSFRLVFLTRAGGCGGAKKEKKQLGFGAMKQKEKQERIE